MKLIAILVTLLASSYSVEARSADAYPPVQVEIAEPANVPDQLAKLLAALLTAADNKDLGAVKSHVDNRFFWNQDHGGGYDAKRPPGYNFATALSLDPKQIKAQYLAASWRAFKALLDPRSASRFKKNSGILCLRPKGRILNKVRAKQTTAKFGTDPWYGMKFALGLPVLVRATPQADAPIVGRIVNEAVLVRRELRQGPDAAWEPVHLPSGAKGWARQAGLRTFLDAQLCFARRSNAAWKIVGYNGGGD